MENESNLVVIDAQATLVDINEIIPKQICSLQLNSVLDDLTIEEYKSMFFLLMDYVGADEFSNISKQEKIYLKEKLDEILKTINDDSIIPELLATLKMYKKLRTIGTCHHVFEKLQHKKFNNIDEFWKMLYSLCEELTDIDLELLKQIFPENIRDQIGTAEDWFYWALRNKVISKTDVSKLEKIFQKYPSCLEIIKNFEKPKSYDIRTPTTNIHCGIAVILNFETFNEKFRKREGSNIDVNSLKDVWNSFGFKTEVYNNLTYEETLRKLRFFADLDHSDYDVFVCCILSHGLSNTVISSDCIEMPIPVLIAEITNNCSSLNSKPKLFFIQACQGTNIQQGFGKPVFEITSPDMPASTTHSSVSTTHSSTPPITSDVLLAISSIDGYVSFRSLLNGSWFIDAFCTVMKQKGDKFSILDIMIEVNNIVRHKSADFGPGGPRKAQQIVNCYNTFGKILVLKKRAE